MKRVIAATLGVILPTCETIAERVSASRERRMGLWERIRLVAHMALCVFCKRYWRQLLTVERVVRSVARRDGGERMPDDVRERIKQALRERSGER